MRRQQKQRQSGRSKGEIPEGGWQNAALWEEDDDKLRGNISFTLDFLDLLLDKIDNEEIEIEENNNGDECVKLKIVLRPNDDAGGRRDPVMYGNVYFPQGKGTQRRKGRSRRR